MKNRTTTWMLALAAIAALVFLGAGFAPAEQEKPELPDFPKRPLPLEWNGAQPKPDFGHMFRAGHRRQATLDHMYRRR